MELYFSKFPTINYKGYTAKNLTRRVALPQSVNRIPTIFYPYEIDQEMRADQLSSYYYNSGYYDWLIYLTNEIIDPYYGWYLSPDDFDKFIIKKYGSQEIAFKKIKFYRLDWSNTLGFADEIDPSFYNNQLPFVLRKYYTPVFGYGAKILYYNRRKEDWAVNTNMVIKLTVSDASDFNKGDLCSFTNNGNDYGFCEVVSIDTTNNYIWIQHCEGNFIDKEFQSNTYISVDSNTSVSTLITAKEEIRRNIPAEEFVYWSKVTAYDYENEKNESRKHLRILDKNYVLSADEELRLKLKE